MYPFSFSHRSAVSCVKHVWPFLLLVKRHGARWRHSILGLAKVSALSAFVAWKLEVLTFHFTRHGLTCCPAAQIRYWTEGVVCIWHWLIVCSSVSNDWLAPAADTRVKSSKRWPRMKCRDWAKKSRGGPATFGPSFLSESVFVWDSVCKSDRECSRSSCSTLHVFLLGGHSTGFCHSNNYSMNRAASAKHIEALKAVESRVCTVTQAAPSIL